MLKWFRKILSPVNYKLLNLILVIVSTVWILVLVNLDCHQCLEDSWAKICITYFTILITIIELGGIFKKPKHKKIAIFITILSLFLVNVWDTRKESIEYKKEIEDRKDLIKADSIRLERIFIGLRHNFSKAEATSRLVVETNQVLDEVKDKISNQVLRLEDVVRKSEEYVELQNSIFLSKKPNLVLRSTKTIVDIDSTGTIKAVKAHIENAGGRSAYNIKLFGLLVFYDSKKDRFIENIDLEKEEKIIELKSLPSAEFGGTNTLLFGVRSNKNINYFKSEEGNFWILVVLMVYEDEFSQTQRRTYYLSGEYQGNEEFDYTNSGVSTRAQKEINEILKNKNQLEFFNNN